MPRSLLSPVIWHLTLVLTGHPASRASIGSHDPAALSGRHFEFIDVQNGPRGFWHILMRRRER